MTARRRRVVAGLAGAAAGMSALLRHPAWPAPASPGPGNPPDPAPPADPETVLLRLAGDDASATTVMPDIAKNFLINRGASEVLVTDAAAPPWTAKISGRLLSGTQVAILIAAATTAEGYAMFAAGQIDIWIAALAATPDQMKALARRGAVTSMDVARYALVVMVPPSNPVQSVSYDQLRDIYAGRITNWQQVGGHSAAINLYDRLPGSAAQETFRINILGPTPIAPSVRRFPLFADLRNALLADPNGIGYLTFNFATGLKPLNLTERGRISSRPDPYGLETGDYPLDNLVVLYRLQNQNNDLAASFFRETRSALSQYRLAIAGYSAVDPRLLVPRIDPPLPVEYRTISDNALRVSTTIRFEPGAAALDDVGKSLVDALATYLRNLSVTPNEVIHLCFSEDTGDVAKNLAISGQLGAVVAKALRERGVLPGPIRPMGAALPLASDAIQAGERRNRRVETWIRPYVPFAE
ncbi:MAG TPA: substrate-binding domain-containing protein [Acetobacteraceae bacterium]|nr:substrate-binding domain-containing protein [Acetobacteraceae bacterium]